MPRTEHRTTLVACIALIAVLLYAGSDYFTESTPSAWRRTGNESLPAKLSDEDFWQMVTDFSEPGGYFRSDNFLSNESGYQYIIPGLTKIGGGGAYLGVGPEQNFTYILALQPKIAFVIDIRRGNMLEHLLYKAFMELAADRAEFLSMLFARPSPSGLHATVSPESLFHVFGASEPNSRLFDVNLRKSIGHLKEHHGFVLSEQDEQDIEYVYTAFFESGPDLSYQFLGGGGRWGMPTYSELMTETDGKGHNWSFLATEKQFQALRQLQRNNLIVPLVGDFGGKKAIRSVGEYLKRHNAAVTAFYTSNVEQYLFQDYKWEAFYNNVAELPLDSSSMFIRFVLNSRGFGFTGRFFGSRSRTMSASINKTIQTFNSGEIRNYSDVVEMSR